jgi:hypothetical protein
MKMCGCFYWEYKKEKDKIIKLGDQKMQLNSSINAKLFSIFYTMSNSSQVLMSYLNGLAKSSPKLASTEIFSGKETVG